MGSTHHPLPRIPIIMCPIEAFRGVLDRSGPEIVIMAIIVLAPAIRATIAVDADICSGAIGIVAGSAGIACSIEPYPSPNSAKLSAVRIPSARRSRASNERISARRERVFSVSNPNFKLSSLMRIS